MKFDTRHASFKNILGKLKWIFVWVILFHLGNSIAQECTSEARIDVKIDRDLADPSPPLFRNLPSADNNLSITTIANGEDFRYAIKSEWFASVEFDEDTSTATAYAPQNLLVTTYLETFSSGSQIESFIAALAEGTVLPLLPYRDSVERVKRTGFLPIEQDPFFGSWLGADTTKSSEPDYLNASITLADGLYLLRFEAQMEPPVNNDFCPVPEENLFDDYYTIIGVGDNLPVIWNCSGSAKVDLAVQIEDYIFFQTYPQVEQGQELLNDELVNTLRGVPAGYSLILIVGGGWNSSSITDLISGDKEYSTPSNLLVTLKVERFTDLELTQTEILFEETILQEDGDLGIAFGNQGGSNISTFGYLPALEDGGVYLVTVRATMDEPVGNPTVTVRCDVPSSNLESTYKLVLIVGDANSIYTKHPNEEGVCRKAGEPINPHTGAFNFEHTDLEIPGRGINFKLTRYHDSNFVHYDSEFGKAWWSPYFQRLVGIDGNTITFKTGEGRLEKFAFDEETQTWKAPADLHQNLVYLIETEEFVLTGDEEVKHRFHDFNHPLAPGRLKSIEDRFGNNLQIFYHPTKKDPEGRPLIDKIVDTYGREILFKHNAYGFIKEITDFTGRQLMYKYHKIDDIFFGGGSEFGSYGDLRAVFFPEVVGNNFQNDYSGENRKKIIYHYDKNHSNILARHALTAIKDANGRFYLKNTYSQVWDKNDFLFGRILSQDYGRGLYNFHYEPNPENPPAGAEGAALLFIENDRRGIVTETYYNATGNALLVRNYTGFANDSTPTTPSSNRPSGKVRPNDPDYFETKNLFNADGLSTTTVHPNGDYEGAVYDEMAQKRHGQNNVIQKIIGNLNASEMLVSNMTYEPLFGKLKTTVEPNGNTTTYFYDYEEQSLEDLNGDGITNSQKGLIVRIAYPEVTEGLAATSSGGTQQAFKQMQYNSFGQLTQEIDPEGVIVRYEYYPNNDPDGDGLLVLNSEDISQGGYLKSKTIDPDGLAITTSFKYDAIGNLIERTDPNGNVYTFVVNAHNQTVKEISPVMNTFSEDAGATYEKILWYDANGNVAKIWTELQNSLNDAEAGVPGFESSSHYEEQYTYDELDNVKTIRQEVINHPEMASEHLVTYDYDKNENVIKITYSNGDFDRFVYDERDLKFKEIIGASGSEPSITRYHYTANGKISKIIYPNSSNVVLYTYDEFDRLKTIKNAINTKIIYEYDQNSNVVDTKVRGEQSPGGADILLNRTVSFYDERNRNYKNKFFLKNLSIDQNISTLIEQVGFNRNNLLFKTLNRNGNRTLYEYDSANRLTRTIDAIGNTKTATYDKNGNILQEVQREKDSATKTLIGTYTLLKRYDELNRLRETEDDLGNITHLQLDSRGLIVKKIDAENNTHEMHYDGLGRETSRLMDAQNGPINQQKIYDTRSRLTKSIDGDTKVTEFQYDAHSRLTQRTSADSTTRQYTYDVENNLIRLVRENGHSIGGVYDNINRLLEINYKNASEETQIQDKFEYNGLNQTLTEKTALSAPGVNNGSQITYQYDNRGLPLSCTQEIWDPQQAASLPPKTFTRSYDDVGNLLSLNYPGGREVLFGDYNEIELLRNIKTNGFNASISGQTNLNQYQYHGFGRIKSRTSGAHFELMLDYDPIKRISSSQHLAFGQSPVRFFETYNKVHTRLAEEFLDEVNSVNSARVYEVDSYQRVIGHINNLPKTLLSTALSDFSSVLPQDGDDHQVLTFDHSNNLSQVVLNGDTVAFTHNEMNETTSISGVRSSLTYDDLGRLISYSEGTDAFELFWNARDQLTSVSKNGSEIASYEYYPSSPMRSLKRVNNGVTESFYGISNLILEIYHLDGTGVESASPVKEFVQEGLDRPLAMFADIDENPTTGALEGREAYFYHTNPRGDVYALSNESGAIVERYDYSLYGQVEIFDSSHTPIAGNTSQYGNPFLFGAVYFDEETRYYWMRHRYYDPTLRGFLSRDPAEDDSLGNLYAAFENHPGKYSDPMGLGNWAMEYEPGYFVSAVLKVGELVDTVVKDPIGVTRAVAVDIVSQPFYTAQDLVYAMAEMNDEQIRRLGYPGYRSWLIGTLERKIMDGSSGLEAFASVVTEGAISYAVPAIGFKFAGKALGKIAKNCPYNKLAPSKSIQITDKAPSWEVGEVKYALGKPVPPTNVTMEMALNRELHAYKIAEKYNIHLKGSGKDIKIMVDPAMGRGTGRFGRTLEEDFLNGNRVIRLGPDSFDSEELLADTIAHELSHARDYIRGAGRNHPELHKPHGDIESLDDGTVWGSGNALSEYIKGNR